MLHVYTYYTSTHQARVLLDSAAIHGLPIQNLATTTAWNGLQDKLLAMQRVLDTLSDTDICCFVDAYDVVVNCNTDTLLQRFLASGVDLLFGAETQLDPPFMPVEAYPTADTPFRFLNSGVYIGRVAAIRAMMAWGDCRGMNDQEYAARYWLHVRGTEPVRLDTRCQIALNMWAVPWAQLQIRGGDIHYTPFQVSPCFVHFNGGSYRDLYRDFVRRDGAFVFVENPDEWETLEACVRFKQATLVSGEVEYLEGRGHTY